MQREKRTTIQFARLRLREEGEKLGEFLEGEVGGAGARVPLLDAEVDGVGAVLDGGADAVEVARWSEHLGSGARGCGRRGSRRRSRLHARYLAKISSVFPVEFRFDLIPARRRGIKFVVA